MATKDTTRKLPVPKKDLTSLLAQEAPLMELFVNNIRDLYWAENHLVKALPKMRAESADKELQKAIDQHLEVTKGQVARLEQIFELIGQKAIARKCDAMEGLTLEGEGTIEDTLEGTAVRDLGINLSCQKVEHYEIAAYMGAANLASALGLEEVASLLTETLEEEQESLDILGGMAETITKRSLN